MQLRDDEGNPGQQAERGGKPPRMETRVNPAYSCKQHVDPEPVSPIDETSRQEIAHFLGRHTDQGPVERSDGVIRIHAEGINLGKRAALVDLKEDPKDYSGESDQPCEAVQSLEIGFTPRIAFFIQTGLAEYRLHGKNHGRHRNNIIRPVESRCQL